MNIILINGSPRKGGNTEIMSRVFEESAKEKGHSVSKVNLCDVKVNPCTACEYCFSHNGACIQEDGMTDILKLLDKADMVAFASPIYFFGLTAQIVSVINRFYARVRTGCPVSSCVLLLNSASPNVFTGAIAQFKDLAVYLKWENKGVVAISGMRAKGDMSHSRDLDKVRELAANL
jgi:Multimeric flavodoxin WrbA